MLAGSPCGVPGETRDVSPQVLAGEIGEVKARMMEGLTSQGKMVVQWRGEGVECRHVVEM